MPARAKINPSLANAEPISDRDSASGTAYLRRGKNPQTAELQLEREVRLRERNSSHTKVSAQGAGGVLDTGAEIPL